MEKENYELEIYQKTADLSKNVEEIKKLLEDNTLMSRNNYYTNDAVKKDISTIKQIAVFFLVITIIGMIIGGIYGYKTGKAMSRSYSSSYYYNY